MRFSGPDLLSNWAIAGLAATSVLVVLVNWIDPWLVRHRATRRALPIAMSLFGMACAFWTILVWGLWTVLFLSLYAIGVVTYSEWAEREGQPLPVDPAAGPEEVRVG